MAKKQREPGVGVVSTKLTTVQVEFVNAWLYSGESQTETAKVMKWGDRGACSSFLRIPKVKAEIARRKGELSAWIAKQDSLAGVSKEMKAELLWEVAQAGAVKGFDKEGNQIMVNPASTISAIRELNLMVGAHAPTVVEKRIEVTNRTEIELISDIQSLQAEVNELIRLEDDAEGIIIEGSIEGG